MPECFGLGKAEVKQNMLFIPASCLHGGAVRAISGKKDRQGYSFNPSSSGFNEMMVHMAEGQRDLIWLQTRLYMGWACNACNWRDLIPRDVPTLTAPSVEVTQAFQRHKCKTVLRNDRTRHDPHG
jgi:hypothetical protein